MNDLRKGYANTTDGQLHHAEAGSGKHLLLLGETPRTYRFFERLMPLLAPEFHVIALDTCRDWETPMLFRRPRPCLRWLRVSQISWVRST